MKLLLSLLLVLTWAYCQGSQMKCKDPSEEYLKNKLFRQAPDAQILLFKPDITPDQDIRKCPKSVNHSSNLIQERSISPWSYRIKENLNRYPRHILEAYCLCKGCISSPNKEQTSVVSVPFHKEVPVLHKTLKCKRGRFVYKLRFIRIAQLCICRFH
ncbi:interleukin-17D [Xenopus laevis]|uniref:Uncharacterized protein n=2 Tax=Xenopus laevis TaxID=8355 RepID=A0A974H149_XENLA|nr:interleukin-17D [Xenopus laevis]OCT60616.1 hypothetical protein XELAEV_18046642mg [Xenopus laevis]